MAIACSHLGNAAIGIDGARREEQQRVQHAEHGARHQRIVHAHHHQEHHAVEGDRRPEDQQQQVAASASGWKMMPRPAISDPITVSEMPLSTALMAPAMFSPITSSSLVIGVTR